MNTSLLLCHQFFLRISEIGLYDEDGDMVAIKNFVRKGKDDDIACFKAATIPVTVPAPICDRSSDPKTL